MLAMKSTAAASHSSICVTSSSCSKSPTEVANPAMVHPTLRYFLARSASLCSRFLGSPPVFSFRASHWFRLRCPPPNITAGYPPGLSEPSGKPDVPTIHYRLNDPVAVASSTGWWRPGPRTPPHDRHYPAPPPSQPATPNRAIGPPAPPRSRTAGRTPRWYGYPQAPACCPQGSTTRQRSPAALA